MTEELGKPVNPRGSLRQFTSARIGIGHTGVSIPLQQSLAFKLAHAHARDAVYSGLDTEKLGTSLQPFGLPVIQMHSCAINRYEYLQRPDLGRLPDEQSKLLLAEYAGSYDVCVIIADGLSAEAVNKHAPPLLGKLIPRLNEFKMAPLVLAAQGRVKLHTQTYALTDYQQALDDLDAGAVRGRAILIP